MTKIEQVFEYLLVKQNIHISSIQIEQFARYYELLIEWNKKMNLTAITEEEEVYHKHFYDSLTLSFYVDLTNINKMIDVGAGAGFPSIPLKIMNPHLQVTIVDSLNKRINFLDHLTQHLGLENVQLVHGRAEDVGKNKLYREAYDLVTARAVARLSVLNELCIPFVKVNGYFAALKGALSMEELQEAKYSLRILGAKENQVFPFHLPLDDSIRHIAVFQKVKSTPKSYPRKAGTPGKNPLIKK